MATLDKLIARHQAAKGLTGYKWIATHRGYAIARSLASNGMIAVK
jgi:hypothetical protein